MSQKKFSEFNIISSPTSNDFLAGFRDSADPQIENTNLVIKIEDIQKALTEASVSGESLISDSSDLKLKKLLEGFAIKLESTGEVIEISVKEDEINLENLQGIVGLSQGGLGTALNNPTQPGFLMNTNSGIAFVNLGPGFSINNGNLIFTPSEVLTTKGDLLTRNNSSLVRLPVGLDGRVLRANSSASSGLEWSNVKDTDKTKADDLSNTDGYLNDLLVTQSPLIKNLINNSEQLQLGLNVAAIDLSQANNDNSQFVTASDLESTNYDSGWIRVRAYEDPFLPGLFSAANTPNPLRFRIIDNKCFLQGNVYVPLLDLEASEVIVDHNTIPTVKSKEVARGITTGVEYWVSPSAKGLSFPAFLPDGLSLSETYNSGVKFAGRRDVGFIDGEDQYIINSGTPIGRRLTFPVSDIVINTNRTMVIKSVFDFDAININGYLATPTAGTEMNQLYRVAGSFKEGDSALSFEDYANSFNDGTVENRDLTKKYVDQIYPVLKYPFDFNGGNATDWGGSFIYLNEVLTLDEALSLEDIKNAVDNYA